MAADPELLNHQFLTSLMNEVKNGTIRSHEASEILANYLIGQTGEPFSKQDKRDLGALLQVHFDYLIGRSDALPDIKRYLGQACSLAVNNKRALLNLLGRNVEPSETLHRLDDSDEERMSGTK